MRHIFFSIIFILATTANIDAKSDAGPLQVTEPAATLLNSTTTPLDIHLEVQRSLQAIKIFADELKTELMTAMADAGITHAISVCNVRAEEIARDVSEQHGFIIKRVSLRNRNPENAPEEWQKKVLEDFEARKLKGDPVAELTFTDVAEMDTGRQFRFVKAIPTGPICIKCHGVNIEPDVITMLDKLYPDDKARGFLPGDIRGAFVVTRDFTP